MEEKIRAIWDQVLNQLIQKYDITEAAANTWIRPLQVYRVSNGQITFLMNERYDQRGIDYIKHRFYDISIGLAIQDLTGEEYSIEICLSDEIQKHKEAVQQPTTAAVDSHKSSMLSNLNERYTFETFVIGKNNELAQAASVAVADAPGEAYNPLFLYGGAGLGKTHLMHSIAHYIIENKKDMKVLYVTSEKFTNELIDCLKHNKNEEFRSKYRNIDVLLIDDIQFIIGKESTQEEFFHTFNSLYEENKQIIISSDKPPKDMQILDERFRSRFEWGLTADIQPPDYETRMAILNKRAELDNISIDTKIMEYVANNVKSNIRELEGALNKICVFSKLKRKPIDLELAQEALKDLIVPEGQREITPELIIDIVCEHFNVSLSDITSRKKSQEIAYPRQIAMYLCKKHTDKSLKAIAAALGKRDHSTIIHGIQKIENDLETNISLQNTIEVLTKKINPT
ncbi:MAG: chromosomal replication initiator protein DnaA [Lachnospiraceae bacterium]|nr:chromosomal replication initiator protein DnaA [Lachnospiraceae bacterium]